MVINTSILRSIYFALENAGYVLRDFESDEQIIASVYSLEMADAEIFFNLITRVRQKVNRIDLFYELFKPLSVLDIGLIGHFLLTCKSIYIAHDRMIKYQLLISNFINIRYNKVHNEVHWILQMPYQFYKENYDMEALADFELILRLRIEETLSNKSTQPKKIELFHVAGNKSNERIFFFSKKFNCEVASNRLYNNIIYNESVINKDIPYKNYELYKSMDEMLLKKIPEMYENSEYENAIKSILLNNMDNFPLSLENTAKRLFMSPRKLQEILKNKKNTYKNIINEMRILIIMENMNRMKEIKEIAQNTGYHDISSFSRYFKSVFKIAPNEYRQMDYEQRLRVLSEANLK